MHKLQSIQRLLWLWFWQQNHETVSISKIRRICKTLWKQYFPDSESKNSLYYLFYPLLGKGIVEWSGEKCYSLTPTQVLRSGNIVLLVNSTNLLKEKLQISLPELVFEEVSIGTERILISDEEVENVLLPDQFDIKYVESERILAGITSKLNWHHLLNKAEGGHLLTDKWFSWEGKSIKGKPDRVGVYQTKKNRGTEKYFFDGDESYFDIPERDENPDILNLILSFVKMNSPKKQFIYDHQAEKLIIDDSFFPLLLERCLRTLVFFREGGIVEEEWIKKEFFPIYPDDIKYLRNVFKYK